MSEIEQLYFTRLEVCRIFGIDKQTLNRMLKEDDFPQPTKIGKSWKWHKARLKHYIKVMEIAYHPDGIKIEGIHDIDSYSDDE